MGAPIHTNKYIFTDIPSPSRPPAGVGKLTREKRSIETDPDKGARCTMAVGTWPYIDARGGSMCRNPNIFVLGRQDVNISDT